MQASGKFSELSLRSHCASPTKNPAGTHPRHVNARVNTNPCDIRSSLLGRKPAFLPADYGFCTVNPSTCTSS